MIQSVAQKVKECLPTEVSGHGFDHTERVWLLAKKLATGQTMDLTVVELAALLHDADDYKLFGQESADNLTNAKRIMAECDVPTQMIEPVCSIISHMGYSNLLAGFRPTTIEGAIVSDADMLDAIGVNGIIRTLQYAFMRTQKYGIPIFDKEIWPELHLTSEEYKKIRKSDNCINHFFEKGLKLKDLMLTEVGRKEAEVRHQRFVWFLEGFFEENNVPEWLDYLHNFLKNNS